jgi:hypothetical protein
MKFHLNIPLIVALLLATVGGAVSLLGLVSMFSIAFAPVAIGLECGKLASASTLHARWAQLGWFVRTVLTTIVACLVILTSSGLYGFTLEHYLAHVASLTAPVQERLAMADEDIRRQVERIADIERQITQLDAAPALEIASSAKPKTVAQIAAAAKATAEANKLRIAEEARKQVLRDGLASKRDQASAELGRLRSARAEVASQQQAAESEIGALKLIADALGIDAAKVVAVSVASLYDLLAITLLVAASTQKPTEAPAPAQAEVTVPVAPVEAKPARAAARQSSARSKASRKAWKTRRAREKVRAQQLGMRVVK